MSIISPGPSYLAVAALVLAGCAQAPEDAPLPAIPVTLSAPAERLPVEDLPVEDRAAAERAQQAALDEGRVVHWSGSGVLGRIVPRHEWVADGKPCRAYSHVVASEIAIREWRRAACRDGDGAWTVTP